MEPAATYPDRLNHLPIDLRAEVVVADMLEEGITLDDLIINPVGGFKRAFGRDVSHVEWVEAQHKSQRWLQLNLNRSGLYDLLPEGIFHQPTTNDTLTEKEAILREMGIQQQREEAARRFFLPLEQEFFRQRIRLEQDQRAFLTGTDNGTDNLLGWFWELPDFLTPIQTKRLLYLLPVMHRIAGDFTAMTACFEQLVEERVELQLDPPGMVQAEVAGSYAAPLGQWELGNNAVFDGWLQEEGPVLRITVYIDRSERVMAYLPGNNGYRFIDWLAGYSVPLDASFRIELDTSALSNAFLLTNDEAFGRLDFTTTV